MTDLTLTREIAASANSVWRCWTEPELLKQWFAPAPVVTTVAEIDPRPGGAFRTVMVVPDHGEMAGDPGCVLLADTARRLVWTNVLGPDFRPNTIDAAAGEFGFTADIRITPTDTGCTYDVRVMHRDEADRDTHAAMGFAEGWGTAADQLAALAGAL